MPLFFCYQPAHACKPPPFSRRFTLPAPAYDACYTPHSLRPHHLPRSSFLPPHIIPFLSRPVCIATYPVPKHPSHINVLSSCPFSLTPRLQQQEQKLQQHHKLLYTLTSEYMTAIPSRVVCHPTLPVVVAATNSGRCHVWR